MALAKVICSFCNKEFYRKKGHIKENKKLKLKNYCSPYCQAESKKKRISLTCSNPACNRLFQRPLNALSPHNYCSQSCAAKVNNAKYPKRKSVIQYCSNCNMKFTRREKFCSNLCKIQGQIIDKDIIIENIKSFYNKYGRIPLKREFPHPRAARERFGTWNNAVRAAGFTPNPVMFAKKHLAKDGHRCDSLAEKIIDDWLFINKIEHQRSIPYPGNPTFHVDFVVNGYWIEFFGLYGELTRYDELRKEKLQIAKEYQLKFIEIYPKHLFPVNKLPKILTNLTDAIA